MRKFIQSKILMFLVVVAISGLVSSAQAATTDFTADDDIIVTGVSFDGGTADLLIMSGSTAESWIFDNGSISVVNPGTFQIGSSNSSVKSIIATRDTNSICVNNGTPGTSYVELPTTSGTYVITARPSSCPSSGGVSSSGGGGGSSAPSTYQTYNQETKETTTIETNNVAVPVAISADTNLANVKSEAVMVSTRTRAEVAQAVGKAIDSAKESEYDKSIVGKVVSSVASVAIEVREKILTFVTYGSTTTDALGAGERGGVVNSFKEAFGKLPETDTEWEDVVKIANGRWPSQINSAREEVAEGNFKAIYLRDPDRTNPNDDAAVVIMAYGLRSRNRNLESEKAAIKIYEDIFNRVPVSATSWDAVRAIAYSGSTR